jgi:pimeloyl-ACP methyl ester carboxylesterase
MLLPASDEELLGTIERAFIKTNGVRLHVVQSGPRDGPLVILLHGFPEFWYGWRHQIQFLASIGFRVLAPDLRGYNLSDKPQGVAAYHLYQLEADVLGLIDACGQERACLVAHDWGGVLAWSAACRHPERLDKMVVINIPHPAVMKRTLARNPLQVVRSAYALFFQLPWLPEITARLGNWWWPAFAMRFTSRPGTFSETDFNVYREAWSRPGAFRSMLNWYRAFFQNLPRLRSPRVSVPTLLLWGARDFALSRQMANQSLNFCNAGRLVFFEEATHWVQHEESNRVNNLIQDFLLS